MRWSGLITESNRERATTIVSLLTGPSARHVGNRPETSVTIGDQLARRQDKPQGYFRNDGFGRGAELVYAIMRQPSTFSSSDRRAAGTQDGARTVGKPSRRTHGRPDHAPEENRLVNDPGVVTSGRKAEPDASLHR